VVILQELLDKGGIVMFIIMLLSVYVVAVLLFKLVQFIKFHTHSREYVNEIMDAIEDKQYADAVRIAANAKSPLARVLETALKSVVNRTLGDDKKLRAIEESGSRQIRKYETHLRGLEMVATIAPLLGLLGTVLGMVKAFAGIGAGGGQVDPSILASGIWEALLTTVAGLSVAIPALAIYYIVDGRVESMRAAWKDTVTSVLSKCDATIS